MDLRQTGLLPCPVDGSDLGLLDRHALSPSSAHFGVQILKPLPRVFRRRGDNFSVDQQGLGTAIKSADLKPLQNQRPLGPSFLDDAKIIDPLKRGMGQLEISDANQSPRCEAAGIGNLPPRPRGDRRRKRIEGPRLRLVAFCPRNLAEANRAVGQLQFDERLRPKRADPLIDHQRHQADNQHQRNRQRPAGQPKLRLAVGHQCRMRRTAAARTRRRPIRRIGGTIR